MTVFEGYLTRYVVCRFMPPIKYEAAGIETTVYIFAPDPPPLILLTTLAARGAGKSANGNTVDIRIAIK
jgi:hypothetical protein